MSNMSDEELQLLGQYLCSGQHEALNDSGIEDFICATDDSEYSLTVQGVVAAAFIALIFAAVVGNVCVMWIIYSHKVMHHGFNYFLFNMALADLLIAVLNVGSSWTFNLYYDWWYGNFCTVNQFFGVAPTCVSVLSMMALSWDRCQAVVNPLRKRPLSARRTAITITIIWLLSALFALPQALFASVVRIPFYIISTGTLKMRRVCSTNYPEWFKLRGEEAGSLYEHSLFVVLYAVPLCLLSFTFARIALAFRRSDNTVATQNSKRGDQIKAKSKAVKMLALMVAIFMICWAPYHFYHTFMPLVSGEIKAIFYSIYVGIYWLAMSSCAYNPIIYCYANARFRIGFRYAFRWLPFIDFKSEEYELSQLFPDRLRSVAFSKMDRSRSSKHSNGMLPEMNKRKRSRLCMRLLNGGGTTTYTGLSKDDEDKLSPPDIVRCLLREREDAEEEEDDSPLEERHRKEHSRLLNEYNR
ncbi:unnamed protein product, partial [Mesorhabditis spiculigera]